MENWKLIKINPVTKEVTLKHKESEQLCVVKIPGESCISVDHKLDFIKRHTDELEKIMVIKQTANNIPVLWTIIAVETLVCLLLLIRLV